MPLKTENKIIMFSEPQTPRSQNVMTSADVKLNKEDTKYVISDEWETLKPKEDNVKKRETPSLALGIRKFFLMGKIWRPGLEAHERLWDSPVVEIAIVLFCKESSSIVYVVRNSGLYVFGEAFLMSITLLLN